MMRKDRSWKRKQGIKVSSRSESDDRIKVWANKRAKTENTSSTYLPKANHASSQSHKDNEEKAYEKYARSQRPPCWFCCSPKKRLVRGVTWWLVKDPSSVPCNGVLEIKCPYSMAEKTTDKMLKDEGFYCHLVNGQMQLDRNHHYYNSSYTWHCLKPTYMPKGICVERIFPGKNNVVPL